MLNHAGRFVAAVVLVVIGSSGKVPGKSTTNNAVDMRAGAYVAGNEGRFEGNIQLGQPLFVKALLMNPDSKSLEMAIPTEMLGDSCELLISRDDDAHVKEWDHVLARDAVGTVTLPSVKSGDYAKTVSTVWFDDRAPEQAGGARRLVLNEPGRWFIRSRFIVRYPFKRGPGWVQMTSGLLAIEVAKPDEAVKSFAKDVGAVIGSNHIIPPEGRAVLRRFVADGEQPVRGWAEWLLMRSLLADEKWWDGLDRGDAAARKELDALVPAAQRLLAENPHLYGPPHYEAMLLVAAEKAARGDRGGAAALMKEAYGKYGDAASARVIGDAGREPAGSNDKR